MAQSSQGDASGTTRVFIECSSSASSLLYIMNQLKAGVTATDNETDTVQDSVVLELVLC